MPLQQICNRNGRHSLGARCPAAVNQIFPDGQVKRVGSRETGMTRQTHNLIF